VSRIGKEYSFESKRIRGHWWSSLGL